MDQTKPKICFIAQNAYGALSGEDTDHIGGIERQTSLMAVWFAARGYQVSMITWDEGQEDGMMIDGVQVFKMCRRDAGIKGLRFLFPKWTSLCHAMRRANADIYYYNCGDLGLGQIAMWCRLHSRKCVYSVASDPVCDPDFPILKPLRERLLYKYGLMHVDSVVVQTQHQKQMLCEGFGIDSAVIPMPCKEPCLQEYIPSEPPRQGSSHVLWVGRISEEKRFEWLLDVAEKCSNVIFDVLGASNTDSNYASVLTKRAADMQNVKMHGRVPHAEIAKYYRSSSVLCCTSAYEGFPNTFLEAWSLGLPVVSTFDPDGIIARYGLGWNASNVNSLVDNLRTALSAPDKWLAVSEAGRSYYAENHASKVCLPKFEHLFLEVASCYS